MIDSDSFSLPVLPGPVQDEEENVQLKAGLLESPLPATNTETPLVLVLVGKCGSGKSSTSNTLLGEQRFQALRSASSVTLGCQTAKLPPISMIEGQHSSILIVDTPGLGDPEVDREDTLAEIKGGINRIKSTYPKARYCIVLVCGLQTRVSEDDLKEFGYLGTAFGLGFYRHTVMVWTHGDLLAEVQDGLEGYLSRAGDALKSFLADVEGGSVVIDNSAVRNDHLSEEEKLSKRNQVLKQLVEVSLPVLATGKDIELKGKKARRQRQAEMAKRRAAAAQTESFVQPLLQSISLTLSNITQNLRKLVLG